MASAVTIDSLVAYPVKGCAGVAVTDAEVTATGLAHDRSFMLVDADGGFVSQRTRPAMAVIRPRVLGGGARLVLSAPGAPDLALDVRVDGPRLAVSVFAWDGKGVDQGDEAAEWCSAVLGERCRLVRVPPEHDRVTSGETPGSTGFADGHALLVASLSSLDHLNARIIERGAQPVPMNRFRPNVVVTGWAEPHTEDRVRRAALGGVEVGFAKVCVRCTVPMVEQETGRRDGPEPIRTLADYRREPDGGVSFGMKAAVLRPGRIAVGDPVHVHAWAT
ncbi:MOSC domain-containing protein [Gandjariella thermophila]|uniref:MOSC domain-containing protein n=1 Tax=Gandjariella thermophila TaxID=1931992 RepID=UPI001CEF70AB|nr:MOSC N-terminal beta barrel domain-containing protein [Gandjariella thermophila]